MSSPWKLNPNKTQIIQHNRPSTLLPVNKSHDYYHNFDHRLQSNASGQKKQKDRKVVTTNSLLPSTGHSYNNSNDNNINNTGNKSNGITSGNSLSSEESPSTVEATPLISSNFPVGKSFAAVVASSVETSDVQDRAGTVDDEDVDDGFEDGTCASQGSSNQLGDATADAHIKPTSSQNGDTKSEAASVASKQNTSIVLKDIPERFKKLLKAASDKATAQRLRVEGAPLIRGFPQADPSGYLLPETSVSADGFSPFTQFVTPSYSNVVGIPQPFFFHPSIFGVEFGDSSAKNISLGLETQKSDVSYVQKDSECRASAANFVPDPHFLANNSYLPLVPYGHMTYYISPGHQYGGLAFPCEYPHGGNAYHNTYYPNPCGPYENQQMCVLSQLQQQQQQFASIQTLSISGASIAC